ncbi:hypothetical protein H0H93_003154 [Arthromyces matolae]|nr:hypothetical protein H0H93_003154 [Arthromyces matolae]
MTGADRLLSLVEQEINRAAAQNQVKLDDLQARFDDYRKQAADEQQRLADRVRVLEAELALKAADVASTTKSSSQSSDSRDDALLDIDTVNLLRSLASLVKAAESTMKEKGAESTTIDTSHFPESWLPTLAQYIAYHKKKFQELQQRQSAIEQERDRLLEDMISKSRQSPLPATVNPAATMSNPYRPVHR